MNWFAVHVITYFKFEKRYLGGVPVWENVVVVRARNRASAARKAERESRPGLGNFGGLAAIGGRKGSVAYAGVRKVHLLDGEPGRMDSGDEVSYVGLTVASMKQVRALAAGKRVEAVLDDTLADQP